MSGTLSYDRPEVLKFGIEKRLDVKVEPNECKSHSCNEDVGDPYPSLYFRTCMEELSRNYLSYTIAAEDSPTMEVVDSKPKNAANLRFPAVWQLDKIELSLNEQNETKSDDVSDASRFMCVYHPVSSPMQSNFRSVPMGSKEALGDWTCGYTKVLLNIGPQFKVRYNKNHAFFEPIFGSISLYSMNKKIDTHITKITESFHFDATPHFVRDSFVDVYQTDLNPEAHIVKEGGSQDSGSVSAQAINPHSDCSRCLFCVPTNLLETHDIFIVVQLTKVLTGEPDKALLPYISPDKKSFLGNSSSDNDINRIVSACNRLHRFRQPVGLSVVKMFEEDGTVAGASKGGLVSPVYATKYCNNENALKLFIQDLQGEEGGNPSTRPNSHRVLPPRAELDVSLTMIHLGTGGDLSAVEIPEGMPHVPVANNFHFIPSQFLTETAANDYQWHTDLGASIADLISVRSVLPLLHPSSTLADKTMSGFRASVDNSLFLYPSSLENVPKNFRNLCVRVQLVEFDVLEDADCDSLYHNYTVLKNVYSTIPGDFFCESAYTTVSYHKASPEFNDEIKIRLPLKMNENHALFFQLFHVHVKNKEVSRRKSIFSHKVQEDKTLTLFGSGHLPLLANGNSLLLDGDHPIPILEVTETVPPINKHIDERTTSYDTSHDSMSSIQSLQSTRSASACVSHSRRSLSSVSNNAKPMSVFTVRTKALSSFVSQDENLQEYLTCHPPCLGHLPSLSPGMMKNMEYTVLPKEFVRVGDEKSRELSYNNPSHAVNEDMLRDKTMFFTHLGSSSKATKVEVCKHFFGIMRQLTRAMCGGGVGAFSTSFANPFTHSELRCASFIAMVRIFDVVTPENAASRSTEHDDENANKECNFLESYVEYMFDEEVYMYISPSMRKFDANGNRYEKKSAVKLLGGKIMGVFNKTDSEKTVDSIKQLEEEEKEQAFLDHFCQQCETVILQGAVLSAVGKASNEILSTGSVTLTPEEQRRCEEFDEGTTPAASCSSNSVDNHRWWKGCSEMKSLLTEMTESNESLDTLLENFRKNVNPLKESVVIEPILSSFDRLDGFSLRSFVIEEELQRKKAAAVSEASGDGHGHGSGSKKHDPHNYLTLQWWPWMYEVISYQWIALLHIFQEDALDKKGGAVEKISKIEEEEEGEEEDDDGEDGARAMEEGKSYPLSGLKEVFTKKNELRKMLIHHGPILLSMIIKSIALRIHREQKSTPVIMDKDFMKLMEELMGTLAQEVHTKGVSSTLPVRNLNNAISNFLRRMFALIVPLQSAQLVYSYFLSSRKTQKRNFEEKKKPQVDHIKDRFYFLKELVHMEHFFAFNFPLYVGSPHATYRYSPIFCMNDLMARSSLSRIRGIQSPPSHWLAHLLIYEVMCDFNTLEKNMKESAMKLIRSLVVRLSYDKRFQSREYKHRVASMFIPLLYCIVEDAHRFELLSPRSDERKDSLALVIFILQDIPDYLLREELRKMMTTCAINPIKVKYHHSTDSSNVSSTVSAATATSALNKDSSMSDHQKLPIFDMITIFHLIVDSFEFPNEDEMGACLSPSVSTGEYSDNTAPNNGTATGRGTRARVGTNDAIAMLENKYGNKAGGGARASRVARKRSSGDRATGLDKYAVIESSSSTRKKDASSSNKVVTVDAMSTLRPDMKTGVKRTLVSILDGISAAKHVSNESMLHVLHTLRILINESIKVFEPGVSAIYCDTKFGAEMHGVLCYSLNLLLHMLHVKQSEDVLCAVYHETVRILMILGTKNFIRYLFNDSLQYWLRQALLHCGSFFLALREAAATFLGHLLFSSFDNFGSLRPISTTIFAVLNDVVEVLENNFEGTPYILEDGKHLQPFDEAFVYAKNVIVKMEEFPSPQNRRAVLKPRIISDGLSHSFDKLFLSMRGLLSVYSFIHLKLNYLGIKFDWKGGNSLDTTDYEDSHHTSTPKKSVGFDVVGKSLSTAIEGVDLEWILELMVDGAALLSSYELPRARMHILENLARMQDILGNNAEAGGARWEIYLTLKNVEKHVFGGKSGGMKGMSKYWCPRPPLKLNEPGMSFMSIMNKSLAQPAPIAWPSEQLFYKHMTTVLTKCAKCFQDAKLTFLAERSYHALIECYRRENFDENESLPLIAKVFQSIHDLYAMSSVGRTTFAMGTFYRVQFLGRDVSETIRNKEFVVRNADYMHLSEFQNLIKTNLSLKHVSKDVPISVLPDTAPQPADDAPGAFIVMTALKPIFDDDHDQSVYSKNMLRKFQFSIPFTKGGKAHAKTIDLQWKRTIYIEVPQPFPYLTFRQSVSCRTSQELSPIEVAIDDIEERNVAMKLQLQLKSSKDQMFINNLMRLVQGTVAPQVNAGAAEVAKTFLSVVTKETSSGGLPASQTALKSEDSEYICAESHRLELKTVLVEFLKRSKRLLERARVILGTGADARRSSYSSEVANNSSSSNSSSSSSGSSSSGSSNDSCDGSENLNSKHNSNGSVSSSSSSANHPPPPPPVDSPPHQLAKLENHHMVWQQEMDKGFEALLEAIYPYIRDVIEKNQITAIVS